MEGFAGYVMRHIMHQNNVQSVRIRRRQTCRVMWLCGFVFFGLYKHLSLSTY